MFKVHFYAQCTAGYIRYLRGTKYRISNDDGLNEKRTENPSSSLS